MGNRNVSLIHQCENNNKIIFKIQNKSNTSLTSLNTSIEDLTFADREMVQQLRVLPSLPEDLNSATSTHGWSSQLPIAPALGLQCPILASLNTCTHVACMHAHTHSQFLKIN